MVAIAVGAMGREHGWDRSSDLIVLKRWRGRTCGSDADEPVGSLDEPGHIGWGDPPAGHDGQVVVGRPTGDRAALSDVDRDLMLAGLGEQVPHRRYPDPFDRFADLRLDQFGGVAGQHDTDAVPGLHRAVDGEV